MREHRLMVYAETGAGRRELEEVWGGEEEGGSGEGRRRCWPRSLPDLAKKSSRLAARPVAPWLSSKIDSRRNDPENCLISAPRGDGRKNCLISAP